MENVCEIWIWTLLRGDTALSLNLLSFLGDIKILLPFWEEDKNISRILFNTE